MKFPHVLWFCISCWLMVACGKQSAQVPDHFQEHPTAARIYPDYKDITIPPNIAPLNFAVEDSADAYVVRWQSPSTSYTVGADAGGEILIDSVAWRQLLQTAQGQQIAVDLFERKGDTWYHLPKWHLEVAKEPIDPYLYYRLIEPGYELYRQLGIYQRHLESDVETPIYENNRSFQSGENHCVNCHNFQNYATDRMLFHVRENHGGTMLYDHGKWEKLGMRTDSMVSGTVYPTWHPTENWVVFSSNKTGQAFHMIHKDRVEVVDYASDLVFYDVAQHKICNIFKTKDWMETFPCWAPNGKTLYYCAAYCPDFAKLDLAKASQHIIKVCDSIYYNIYKMDFDPQTRTFGAPELVVEVASQHQSAAFPRISPDGKYLLYTVARTGQFHIWHQSSDLWVKNLETGETYPLTAANSPEVDSYHTWSSNGRWIAFASRRGDSNFSRPYFAYFDRNGQSHKAFALPHHYPYHDRALLKSYNVPELTKTPLRIDRQQLKSAVYDDAHTVQVKYDAQLIHHSRKQ